MKEPISTMETARRKSQNVGSVYKSGCMIRMGVGGQMRYNYEVCKDAPMKVKS